EQAIRLGHLRLPQRPGELRVEPAHARRRRHAMHADAAAEPAHGAVARYDGDADEERRVQQALEHVAQHRSAEPPAAAAAECGPQPVLGPVTRLDGDKGRANHGPPRTEAADASSAGAPASIATRARFAFSRGPRMIVSVTTGRGPCAATTSACAASRSSITST